MDTIRDNQSSKCSFITTSDMVTLHDNSVVSRFLNSLSVNPTHTVNKYSLNDSGGTVAQYKYL